MDRITIKMDAQTNLVSYEVQTSQNAFPISLVQMMLAEAARQLETRRSELENFSGRVQREGDFTMEVTFDPATKHVSLSSLGMLEVPIAQMAVDEVIRLMQEQRNYGNIKITQQRLAEEKMLASLASGVAGRG